ncbi:hypothetical protein BV898_01011 [Hypsibius exemplaris]|uniref:Uncharacterized protein n=1 Tax=Hypsibius exemplaris TaxID=2072580 RepID=A0A1W0XD00_HYPEX|nr:hypothetical protein BV898_01011 [Hypsibius exemplaris]
MTLKPVKWNVLVADYVMENSTPEYLKGYKDQEIDVFMRYVAGRRGLQSEPSTMRDLWVDLASYVHTKEEASYNRERQLKMLDHLLLVVEGFDVDLFVLPQPPDGKKLCDDIKNSGRLVERIEKWKKSKLT